MGELTAISRPTQVKRSCNNLTNERQIRFILSNYDPGAQKVTRITLALLEAVAWVVYSELHGQKSNGARA